MNPQKSDKLFNTGLKIVRLIAKKGHLAFFVGGVVRDMLLKRESNNIDIATDATPDQIEEILESAGFDPKPLGKKFGTILTVVDKTPVEITTFRSEGRYSDNRHPDQVQFIKDYLDDAKRRDFTINALYFDPIKKQIYDPTNGQKDLKLKLIRFVGDAKKRIDEDALRMLRAVRLSTQLGFKLEKNSFAAIKTRAKYIQDISGERIKAELDKIVLSDRRTEGIWLLDKVGLLKFIAPDLEEAKKHFSKSKIYHLEGDRLTHALLVADNLKTRDLELIYAALFHDTGKNFVETNLTLPWAEVFKEHIKVSVSLFEKFSKRLKFSNASREKVIWLINNHDHDIVFIDSTSQEKIKFISNQYVNLELDLWQADIRGNITKPENIIHLNSRLHGVNAAIKYLKDYNLKKPLIEKLGHGDLIMKYSKLKPGRELGKKIEDVKVEIVLGRIKNENDLKKYFVGRKNT